MSFLRYLSRRAPVDGVPVAKAAVAATLSFLAARYLVGPAPILAPLTALLVVQSTVSATLRSALQRVASVVAGVLIAVTLSTVVGLTWWSLGIVVLLALLVGRRLRLGDQLLEMPISAMLVLAVTWQTDFAAFSRVEETLVGAVVGLGVALAVPALYVQTAGDAIGGLGDEIVSLLRHVGDRIERTWNPEEADAWLHRSRTLTEPVQAARDAVVRGEESLRLNPRRHVASHAPSSLMSGLTALEYSSIHARVICRSLLERVAEAPVHEWPSVPVRVALSDLFAATADAVEVFAGLVGRDVTGPAPDTADLRAALQWAHAQWNVAAELMVVDGDSAPTVWQAHGALLAHFDRLLDEIDPDAAGALALGRHPQPRRRRFRRVATVARESARRPVVRSRERARRRVRRQLAVASQH